MEKDYLDIAYTKRVERSQALADTLIKVYPEYFKNLSICQQRNFAIILNNTIKWLHSLSSKQLENDEIDSAAFLKNTINSYLKFIENDIEVIGLEVPFTTFKSNDNKMTYCIKASCQHQNADEFIKKCKSMPENQNHYVSILCFTKDYRGINTIFGSFDCIPFKISY